ncbi:MAG: SDR family oxidoreductase [Acholeplasmataceae bacterium]|nr:SDR family oxidoreductase [Acholeplasmataceae bacterium]
MKKIEKGTYAIVTGASSGIGRAIALELAAQGANLILVARRRDRLEQLKAIIVNKYKVDTIIFDEDLTKAENCKSLYENTKKYNAEIIVNNAGFGICGFFSEGDLDLELEMIRLNIESLHILTKLYLSTMSKGVIMNVASVAGFIPTPLMATYAATKAYVNNFSRALNYEMKVQKRDIRVLSLCPGPVKTDFWTIAKANQSKYALPVERCARAAVRGIINNKLVIIPGKMMKFARLLIKILPVNWILPTLYKIQKRK